MDIRPSPLRLKNVENSEILAIFSAKHPFFNTMTPSKPLPSLCRLFAEKMLECCFSPLNVLGCSALPKLSAAVLTEATAVPMVIGAKGAAIREVAETSCSELAPTGPK